MPEKKPRTPKTAPPLEKQIQKAIIEYLALRGHWAKRNNVGSASGYSGTGKKWFMRYGEPGEADITVYLVGADGRPTIVHLEVKRPGGKQSEEQIAWQARAEKHGHQYFVVRSVDDVIAARL